jgi:hypothetical protein
VRDGLDLNLLNCREQVGMHGNLQKRGLFCFGGLTCSRLGETRKKNGGNRACILPWEQCVQNVCISLTPPQVAVVRFRGLLARKSSHSSHDTTRHNREMRQLEMTFWQPKGQLRQIQKIRIGRR